MKRVFISLILVTITKIGLACTCEYYESDFYYNLKYSSHFAAAVFNSLDENYKDNNGYPVSAGYFTLIDTIGTFDSDLGDTILILGHDGLNCGEELNKFSIGDTVFLSLKFKLDEPVSHEAFHLEGLCGKYYLEFSNGLNNGLTIGEVKAKIKTIISGTNENKLVKEGVIWSVNVDKYAAKGDTLINNQMYLKYYQTSGDSIFTIENAEYYASLREEGGKVWYIYRDSTSEKLLYDFTLEVGEKTTVSPSTFGGYTYSVGIPVTILEIDLIEINSQMHKRIKIGDEYGHEMPISEYWIEGIGSTAGLFSSGLLTLGVADIDFGQLYCYTYNDNTTYFSTEGKCFGYTWVNTHKIENDEIEIYPNPSTDFIQVKMKGLQKSLKLEIFNLVGQKVLHTNLTSSIDQVSLKNIPAGSYVYKLTDNNVIIQTGNLLKQ